MNSRILPFLLILVFLFCGSCKLSMDTPKIIEKIFPQKTEEVLPAGAAPSVTFSRNMDKESVERILEVSSSTAPVSGAWSWEGRTVSFTAYGGYEPARVYRLDLQGELYDERGSAHFVSRSIPFFVGEGRPSYFSLISMEPARGSSLEEAFSPITLRFDEPVAKEELDQALGIYPETSFETELQDPSSGYAHTLTPAEPGWRDSTMYSLAIDGNLVSTSGKKLEGPFEALFYSSVPERPLLPPEFSTVRLEWPPPFPVASEVLEEVQEGESFRFDFARPVLEESINHGFSLSPYCEGSLYPIDETSFVFLPEGGEAFPPDTEYTIEIGTEAEGVDGGSLQEPFCLSFTTEESPRPVRIEGPAEDGFPLLLPHDEAIPVSPTGVLGSYTLTWKFNRAVEEGNTRTELQENLEITPIFPPDIGYPSIIHLMWLDTSTLVSQIEGIGEGAAGRSCYYRITLPLPSSKLYGNSDSFILLEYQDE